LQGGVGDAVEAHRSSPPPVRAALKGGRRERAYRAGIPAPTPVAPSAEWALDGDAALGGPWAPATNPAPEGAD
jgi:hypothetical protein